MVSPPPGGVPSTRGVASVASVGLRCDGDSRFDPRPRGRDLTAAQEPANLGPSARESCPGDGRVGPQC
jgi:hypothetical protein